MTTAAVPGSRRVAAGARVTSRLPAVLTSTLTATGLSLLLVQTLVVLAWASDGRSDVGAGDASRAGLLVWLSAHHVGIDVGDASFSVTPLLLTCVVVSLLARGGAALARQDQPPSALSAARLGLAMAPVYAVVVALLSGLARVGAARASAPRALVAGAVVAGLAGALGAVAGFGWRRAWAELGRTPAACVEAAGASLLVLLGGGLVAVFASLSWHLGRAVDLVHAVDAGIVGALLLVVLSVLLLPNAAVWATAYALGTGFAVGVGTAVTPGGVRLGAVPSLPLLAALPAEGSAPRASWLMLALPVVAGVVAGTVVVRRLRLREPARAALLGALVGLGCGVVVALACWLSGGSAGAGRLSQLGPDPLLTGIAAAEWVGFIAAASAALLAHRACAAG